MAHRVIVIFVAPFPHFLSRVTWKSLPPTTNTLLLSPFSFQHSINSSFRFPSRIHTRKEILIFLEPTIRTQTKQSRSNKKAAPYPRSRTIDKGKKNSFHREEILLCFSSSMNLRVPVSTDCLFRFSHTPRFSTASSSRRPRKLT